MKHIVSVGGGITSTLLLPLKVIEKYGRDNVVLVMAMLKNDESSARPLVEAVERYLDMPIERITANSLIGKRGWRYVSHEWAVYDIWDVFNRTGMMGSTLADPCSRMLKREVLAAYMADMLPGCVLHVGITVDEIDRMLAIRRNWGRIRVEADLADDPTLTREKATAECERLLGFVPELYRRANSHNNCAGFCVKAGHAQMARLLFYDRAEYLRHEANELAHQQRFNHAATIMRDRITRNGIVESTPLTLQAFRQRMETRWSGMMFDPFDDLEDTPGCRFCEAA